MIDFKNIPAFVIGFVLLLHCGSFAQVHINKTIEFDTTATQSRTIEGLVLAADSTSGIPHIVFIQTGLNYISDPSGTTILLVNLISPVTAYPQGLELYIKAATNNAGSLFINVNGLGVKEVRKKSDESLFPNDIGAGQIFKVIYDGTYFMMQSPSGQKCPNGFLSINDNFCMEQIERSATLYLTAVNTCYSLNARLCTWGEWYYACQNASLGLVNMVSNYEYVDDTSDHSNTVLVAGRTGCTDFYANLITAPNVYTYRCCYNK